MIEDRKTSQEASTYATQTDSTEIIHFRLPFPDTKYRKNAVLKSYLFSRSPDYIHVLLEPIITLLFFMEVLFFM